MPRAPGKPCAHHGCASVVYGQKWCKEHQRSDWRRKTAHRLQTDWREEKRFYDSAGWQRLRLERLRIEPLCRMCKAQGRISLAKDVDHIERIRSGGERLSLENTQSLCKQCHARKSGREARENPGT